MTYPDSWAASPDEARLRWHDEARRRDEARLAEGPDGDVESDESPWRDARLEL